MNPSVLVTPTHPTQQVSGEPYLQVRLESQNMAILPMSYLQEVLVVPVQRLTPIPNVPACLLGLLARRSRILWAIDLARLLQLPSSVIQSQRYNMVVVQVGNTPMGLVVQNIEGIMRLSSDRIQLPSGTVSAGLVPYLRGCVFLEQQMLLVLEPEAIARSPLLHSY